MVDLIIFDADINTPNFHAIFKTFEEVDKYVSDNVNIMLKDFDLYDYRETTNPTDTSEKFACIHSYTHCIYDPKKMNNNKPLYIRNKYAETKISHRDPLDPVKREINVEQSVTDTDTFILTNGQVVNKNEWDPIYNSEYDRACLKLTRHTYGNECNYIYPDCIFNYEK